MACLGSKSSIDLTEASVFVQSRDPASAGQLSDFLDMGDRSGRTRPGEEVERRIFVVADRLKCKSRL
jgi:hypothetical protein